MLITSKPSFTNNGENTTDASSKNNEYKKHLMAEEIASLVDAGSREEIGSSEAGITQRKTKTGKFMKSIISGRSISKFGDQNRTKIGHSGLTLRIFVFMLSVSILMLCRFFIMRYSIRENVFISLFMSNTVNIYVGIISVSSSMVDLIYYNNENQIEYMSAIDYYTKQRDRLRGELLNNYLKALHEESGASSSLIKELNRRTMCEVFQKLDPDDQPFKNCEIAMGGIVNKPIEDFLLQYTNICDQLVQEWKLLSTYEERQQILKREPYNSLVAYSFYNHYGTGDGFFFYFMLESVRLFLNKNDSIQRILNLISIVSFMLGPLLVCFFTIYILFKFNNYQWMFWRLIYTIPVSLVEDNTFLKQRMKNSITYDNFAYYD